MSAIIHWEFVELRNKQIEAQKNERAAEILAFALEGAPQSYYPQVTSYSGTIDSNHRDDGMIYYVTPPVPMWSDDNLPSDSEPKDAG